METMKLCKFGFAALALATVEPTAFGADRLLRYEVKGGIAASTQTLDIDETGGASYSLRAPRTAPVDASGRLEIEEIAGLAAALADLPDPAGGGSSGGAGTGADGSTRKLYFRDGGVDVSRILDPGDPSDRPLIGWLEGLSRFVQDGDLDDANKDFEAKLQRPDLGGLSVSIVIANKAHEEVRFEIDAHGMRTLESKRALVAEEAAGVAAMVALVDPGANPGIVSAPTKKQRLYTLRFWDPNDASKRRDVHPLAQTIVGLPAMDILIYMLDV